MQLIRLIYASVAEPGFALDDYRQIRASAKAYNEAHGISGILCYSNGAFLQAIEGRRVPVNNLYNRIIRDTRHTKTELLICGPIEMRSFIDWSMKMISWDEAYTPQRRALVMRHSGMQGFEPWTMSAGQALGFLTELAELERRKDLRGGSLGNEDEHAA
jgi:Sensors of blue-light using FAD